jgi:hypothetical protein
MKCPSNSVTLESQTRDKDVNRSKQEDDMKKLSIFLMLFCLGLGSPAFAAGHSVERHREDRSSEQYSRGYAGPGRVERYEQKEKHRVYFRHERRHQRRYEHRHQTRPVHVVVQREPYVTWISPRILVRIPLNW